MLSGCQMELLRLEECHAYKITWLWKMTGLGFEPRSETDSRDRALCNAKGPSHIPNKGTRETDSLLQGCPGLVQKVSVTSFFAK